MAFITLRVLHGADRGRVFDRLPTPVTIGREEGNSIRLNDERISRYHLKLQDDNDRIVATDLESTNGTKVNGEEIQVRIVHDGDMIALGRSLLLVGSHEDIDRRIAEVMARHPAGGMQRARQMRERIDRIVAQSSDIVEDVSDLRSPLLPPGPPELPGRLTPAQSAELSELLEYVASVLHGAAADVVVRPGQERVELEFPAWQALLDLRASLAAMLHHIGDAEG